MNKYGKSLIALVICFCMALPCVMSLNIPASVTDSDDREYIADAAAIYREYDVNLSERDKDDPLALNRLVVDNYNGKPYGSVKSAWDKKHKKGLLQYDSREDAKKALKEIRRDGLEAEGDGVAYFDDGIIEEAASEQSSVTLAREQGTMFPSGSNCLGTTQYINKLGDKAQDLIVAIVDTGVMYDHTAIADRFYSTGVDLSSDNKTTAYYDTEMQGSYYGHATSVAGIIADNTPDSVKILPYKAVAFGMDGAAASAIMYGILNATDAGAGVISVSLSTNGCENQLRDAVAAARAQGVCVCASAGNSSYNVDDRFPACTPYAITVSSLESDNQTYATFTNYGECIDFCAPGRRIYSTYPLNNTSGYKYNSGTSFSTPYISACCACIKSLDPDMPRDDVYDTLCDFARDLGDTGYDIYYGNGCPYLAEMTYTDGENYSFSIPENELEIYNCVDYTAETQPWKRFSKLITSVTVDRSVDRIGNYMFCNMPNAEFDMRDVYSKIGDYAFSGCTQIKKYTCNIDVEEVGTGAFSNIPGFILNGYRNTPAEVYALNENVTFNVLGCKHNYKHVVYDPTKTSAGYTHYTCIVCGDQYIGAYIEPTPVATGTCGENLTYTYYDTGRLTIDGTGDMYDYMNTPAPWESYKDDIIVLQLKDGVEDISPFAFYGCSSLSRFFISDGNTHYYDDDEYNLIRKSDGALLLAIMSSQNTPYSVPERVETLNSSAFVFNIPSAVSGNGYSTENGIVYKNGNIEMALPSYKQDSITFDSNISVNDYAFILTPHPLEVVSDMLNVQLGDYSVGYYYDGTMNKLDMLFITNSASSIYTYAVDNEFDVDLGITGTCGEDIVWRYDENTNRLTLSGSGDMYTYESKADIPWNEYMYDIKSVVIGNSIYALSPYSFCKATAMTELTLPLSIKAAEDINTWNGCTAIKKITLTLGTGSTDEYVDGETRLYTYSPWYIARSSITSFNLDENVRYITEDAFRGCTAIKTLTFNCIETIETHAFVACTGLTDITNYCKSTVYEDYSIFSYQFGTATGGYYANKTLHGYCDSTSKDFCDTNTKINFDGIGCGHTRDVSYSREQQRDEFITDTMYLCADCGEEFVYSSNDTGSAVALTVTNKRGMALDNAEVYLDGELFGTADSKGSVSGKVAMDDYSLEIKLHGVTIYEGTLSLDENTVSAQVKIPFANYVNDGAINAKDYAYALRNNFGDSKELFDYGKISPDYNGIIYNED